MDQEKIGQFIAACRKEQGLTQVQLAEQLGITNRAVSKWETAKSMPDVSVMVPLCEILNISVNELLSGERISMEDYKEKAEENLVSLQEKKALADKANGKMVKGFIWLAVLLFPVHLAVNYYFPDNPDIVGKAFLAIYIVSYVIWFHRYYEIKLR